MQNEDDQQVNEKVKRCKEKVEEEEEKRKVGEKVESAHIFFIPAKKNKKILGPLLPVIPHPTPPPLRSNRWNQFACIFRIGGTR